MNILIIGVGEVGHNIVRFLPPVNSIMVADPDVVATHNRSYQGKNVGEKKVLVVLSELREKGYRPQLVTHYNVSPRPRVAYGFCDAISPLWSISDDWLVVECTDDAEMLSLPAIHVHTDIAPDGRAIFSIWKGAIKTFDKLRSATSTGCTDLLARAAVVAAQKFVQLLKMRLFPDFPGLTETVIEEE